MGDSMRTKKKIMATLLVLFALCMTACGSSYARKTPVEKQTDYVTDEMYANATKFLEPEYLRLAAAMRKAERGEEITVAAIGGSITEGFNATDRNTGCYAQIFGDWWEERFPNTKVNVINAGVGGTNSYLGVHRVEKEVLAYKPDVVVVEFSVNDGDNEFCKKSYDNLVRRILSEDYNPAVMLLFTVQENGTNAQISHSTVGYTYRLPMISYANMVMLGIKNNDFTWSDVSNDSVHPNDRGHAMIGELFYNYLNHVYSIVDTLSEQVPEFDHTVVTREMYQNAKFLTASDIEADELGSFQKKQVNWYYQDNWYSDGGDDAIVFTVEAENIGIAYQKEVNKGYGIYDVYVDGVCVRSLDGDFKGGWGSTFETTEVYTSSKEAKHTIEIKKSPDSEGDYFGLVGLLVS